MKQNILCSIAVVGTAVASFGADIVHSPYAAFIDNYNGSAFSNGPQVDANGGIWTYGYRGSVVSTDLKPFSATKFTRAKSVLGGLNKQVNDQFIPYVVINPTPKPVQDRGATPHRAVNGDELVVQPGNLVDGEGSNCGAAVIRFTTPRAGRYSITATCETLSYDTLQKDDGVTSFHLLVGGKLIEERDVKHLKDKGDIYTFTLSNLLLGQNETIELVTGPGITALRNKISYANDSSSVKIEIVEKEGFYSLGDDMANNIIAGNQDNPFCDGRWTAGQYTRRSLADLVPDNAAVTLLKWGFNRETYHVGYSENGTPNRWAVYTCVNTNATTQNILTTHPLASHEVMVLPANAHNADYRFTTPEDGTWRVTAIVRNLQYSPNGISAHLFAGGHRYGYEELRGNTAQTKTLEAVTSKMKAGAFIDLVIDSNGNQDSDTTALKFYVEKVDDAACPHDDGGLSFGKEMQKLTSAANPFTDARGVKWAVGQTPGATGAFAVLPSYLEDKQGYLAGWRPDAKTRLPRLQANYNGVLLKGKDETAFDPNEPLYDDEFYLHPNKNQYGVLRYYAPSTGVYRVWSRFRDCALGDAGMAAPGVYCHVRANESCAASGFACHAQTNKVGTTDTLISRDEVAHLEPRLLYLAANEPIDVSVGITRTAKSDATAVSCRIAPDGGYEEDFVNVDFKAAATAAYAGRGRLGWANPRWNVLTAGSGTSASRSNLAKATGDRTTMTLSVTRGGATLATSTAASGNALLASGFKSTGASDVYTFTVGGLKAGQKYRLCLYGGEQGTGSARAVFTAGGVTQTAAGHWLRADIPEVAIIDATADADGKIVGSFAAQDGNPAVFFGLQVAGSFAAQPSGLSVFVR